MADVWRNGEAFEELNFDMNVEDLSWFKSEKTPVMIEETYEIDNYDLSQKQGHQYQKDNHLSSHED